MRTLLLSLFAALALFTGCQAIEDITGRSPEELAAEAQERAATNMVADGLDPEAASPAEWRSYLASATKQLVLEELEAARGEPDLLETILGVSFPKAGAVYGLLVGAIALFTQRGRRNVSVIASREHGALDTFLALGSVLFGWDSPTPPKDRAPQPPLAAHA